MQKITKYLVNVPVADLRREPIRLTSYQKQDMLQETQLLFNEKVKGFKDNNGWVFVEAIEQQKFFPNGEWRGYPGWIEAHQLIEVSEYPNTNLVVTSPWAALGEEMHVSLGTQLASVGEEGDEWIVQMPDGSTRKIKKDAVSLIPTQLSKSWRKNVIRIGKQLKDTPYLWGGRSAYRKGGEQLTSVDCSSFVELLFRIQGKVLPRDAHDQFLQTKRKNSDQLHVGDLVFLAEVKKPSRISHVMIYAGQDQLIEAEMEAEKVRVVSSEKKLGQALKSIPYGYNNGEYIIYFAGV